MMLVGNQNSLVPQPDVIAVAVGCREEDFEKVLDAILDGRGNWAPVKCFGQFPSGISLLCKTECYI